MRVSIRKIRIAAGSALIGALCAAPTTVLSAPGTLSDVPLFLTNPVEPNILFMVDDSGSMDWGLMTEERDGIMDLGCAYYYAQPAGDNSYTWVVPTEEGLAAQGIAAPYGGVWRAWNSDYNRLYYDPSITYTPWPGDTSSNTLLVDANPAAVELDPYVPGTGSVDVTARTSFDTDYCQGGLGMFENRDFLPAHYFVWTDTDGDGVVDSDDAHTKVEIEPGTPTYEGSTRRRDCAAAPTCSYAEEIQNFANWFAYYRKREKVAKAAYGRVIAGASSSRMGLATLHNNSAVNTAIESMNEDPRTGEKDDLLESLYEMESSGHTPLRNALDQAGSYLACDTNSLFGSCPPSPSTKAPSASRISRSS